MISGTGCSDLNSFEDGASAIGCLTEGMLVKRFSEDWADDGNRVIGTLGASESELDVSGKTTELEAVMDEV